MAERQAAAPEARLLVVDDEPNIVELLDTSLSYAGFEVMTATTGREAVAATSEFTPDLIVLDVMLPDMDGFEVLRLLRGTGARIPVLFLTARDGTDDKISGLTLGADDYVTKPFSLGEVLARVRAVLRRTADAPAAIPERVNGDVSARATFADIEVDRETHEVWKAGKQVTLSPTEFRLLQYFLDNPGKALSKATILDHVWHYDFGRDSNIVESYVSYLRKKVDTTEPRLIHTIRGVGYALRVPRS
ncbi:response regulator transcription factor [Cryptosporangium aurantiacum]|uniref:Two-component system, OmpR family, response regulator n=1 Tax=Cryptosporangium aurantiacum TaxID=134849 RepID=A0A1M7QYE3_9ACTN|nr:response regulator transcription factor [Cryptosporangium aurantiacum]SHN37018.1 two-component system, OmpR family, response regulator [Cryptosporangium aurantiacum]